MLPTPSPHPVLFHSLGSRAEVASPQRQTACAVSLMRSRSACGSGLESAFSYSCCFHFVLLPAVAHPKLRSGDLNNNRNTSLSVRRVIVQQRDDCWSKATTENTTVRPTSTQTIDSSNRFHIPAATGSPLLSHCFGLSKVSSASLSTRYWLKGDPRTAREHLWFPGYQQLLRTTFQNLAFHAPLLVSVSSHQVTICGY